MTTDVPEFDYFISDGLHKDLNSPYRFICYKITGEKHHKIVFEKILEDFQESLEFNQLLWNKIR